MSKKIKKKFTINPATDLTPANLMKYLNRRYGKKKSGEPFNERDVQGYQRRKQLPKEYGGDSIEVIESTIVGIKILRLIPNKKKKK